MERVAAKIRNQHMYDVHTARGRRPEQRMKWHWSTLDVEESLGPAWCQRKVTIPRSLKWRTLEHTAFFVLRSSTSSCTLTRARPLNDELLDCWCLLQ
jgi:hypothetical protein